MNFITRLITHTVLGFILLYGGLMMLEALTVKDGLWWAGFYWGLAVATIPLLIWGRWLLGRLIRLPGLLFKLIHSRWWSALVFWASLVFIGLPPPVAVFAFALLVILPRLPWKRGSGCSDETYYGVGPQYFRNPGD